MITKPERHALRRWVRAQAETGVSRFDIENLPRAAFRVARAELRKRRYNEGMNNARWYCPRKRTTPT